MPVPAGARDLAKLAAAGKIDDAFLDDLQRSGTAGQDLATAAAALPH